MAKALQNLGFPQDEGFALLPLEERKWIVWTTIGALKGFGEAYAAQNKYRESVGDVIDGMAVEIAPRLIN
jgi:hypothetical protein